MSINHSSLHIESWCCRLNQHWPFEKEADSTKVHFGRLLTFFLCGIWATFVVSVTPNPLKASYTSSRSYFWSRLLRSNMFEPTDYGIMCSSSICYDDCRSDWLTLPTPQANVAEFWISTVITIKSSRIHHLVLPQIMSFIDCHINSE